MFGSKSFKRKSSALKMDRGKDMRRSFVFFVVDSCLAAEEAEG